MDKIILQEIFDYLEEQDVDVFLTDDGLMLFVDENNAMIGINDYDIVLQFNLNASNMEAAILTKFVMEATKQFKGYSVEIYESYLDIFDDLKDEFKETLYGEEILEYQTNLTKMINCN